jgi:hypothetical protein
MSLSLSAKSDEDQKPRFTYDVDFEMNFDNREFDKSRFSKAMTIFGARLTPSVGLTLPQPELGMDHKLMVGIDVMKDFGASPISKTLSPDESSQDLANKALFREMTLYYKLDKKTTDGSFEMYAGIFPRKASEGGYGDVFFSDSLKFYDNNLEGLLLKFHRPKSYWEVGCDWMGQYGTARRERFMIFTSGEGKVASILSLGYSGYMYHFANSRQVKGLVDNILVNPYARLDFGDMVNMQTLSLTLGWLQAMQNNRKHVGKYVFPCGGHFDLEVRKWDVAVKNTIFYGTDMMPYYNSHDEGGIKYGNSLYLGDPFYRVFDNMTTSRTGLYDRLEVCYEPVIWNRLDLRVAAVFHFNDFHYSGCQQIVGLLVSF